MILDTTFIVDLLRGRAEAANVLRKFNEEGIPIAITTPSTFEIYSGLAQSRKPAAEIERIHAVLDQQVTWTLDCECAERAGRLHGELARRGESIEPVDAMIGGIAVQHHEAVLTRNAKHFSRIPGLRVETY